MGSRWGPAWADRAGFVLLNRRCPARVTVKDKGRRDMSAVLTTRMQRERETERVQVERARGRMETEREEVAAVLPDAERVDAVVRAVLAGHIGQVLTLRVGRGARSETKEVRLVTLHRAGALGRTGRGLPVWLSYRDLYCAHAVVLEPAGVRDAIGRAVARLRRGAPRGDAR